jgi:hypothetical protein
MQVEVGGESLHGVRLSSMHVDLDQVIESLHKGSF